MPASRADDTVVEAVFRSIKDGTQPDPEAIASGELGEDALLALSKRLQQAKSDVEDEIRSISKQSAPDVDRWISETKQLRADVEDSKSHAQRIVQLAETGASLKREAHDAQSKAAFLRQELGFHESLGATLGKIQMLWQTIEQTREAMISLQLREATELLQKSQRMLSTLTEIRQTGLVSLLQAKIAEMYHVLAATGSKMFDGAVTNDREQAWIKVMGVCKDPFVLMKDIIFVLDATGTVQPKLLQLEKNAQELIYRPRLAGTRSIKANGPTIYSTDEPSELTVQSIVADTSTMLNYFHLVLEDPLVPPFMQIAASHVVSQLLAGPLADCVPPDLSGIPQFSKDLFTAAEFSRVMKLRKWPGSEKIDQWVTDAPKTWLQRRSNGTLGSVRQILGRGFGRTKAVERVETQKVAANDQVFKEPPGPDDWDASWSDEENEASKDSPVAAEPKQNVSKDSKDDEADDAWGFEEDNDGDQDPASSKPENEDEDEDDDAWGWGDDNEEGKPPSKQNSPVATKSPAKRAARPEKGQEREVTLRETYYVTSIPEQILEIIVQVVDDAQSLLHASDNKSNPVQPAGEGLLRLPSDILSMLRACASSAYETSANGNMYLYNDTQHLTSQLRAFVEHHSTSSSPVALSLDSDISALEIFGRRAYGREMESQRTVLRDLLDGAQSFAHCTEPPFAHECELAISSVSDRLKSLHEQWTDVIAPSALLQSIGSLYETITNKVLVDVEDLADISEPESRKLVELCKQLEDLQGLFLPEEEREGAEEDTDEGMEDEMQNEERRAKAAMAASVYTPGLLKFQWLAQILEGSLADIRYWWNESELSLAFPPAEVVDLVEALFADSEHRRRTINEIRRGGRESMG